MTKVGGDFSAGLFLAWSSVLDFLIIVQPSKFCFNEIIALNYFFCSLPLSLSLGLFLSSPILPNVTTNTAGCLNSFEGASLSVL